jgi:hypothetical protein
MGHVNSWMTAHPDLEVVSRSEREAYEPLINAACNFNDHPSGAISILTGENVLTIQNLVLDKTIVDWRKTIGVESVSIGALSIKSVSQSESASRTSGSAKAANLQKVTRSNRR